MKKVFFISMFMFFSLGYSDMNMEIFNKNREDLINSKMNTETAYDYLKNQNTIGYDYNDVYLDVLLKDENSEEILEKLFKESKTNVGKVYALEGLYNINREKYTKLKKKINGKVVMFYGCYFGDRKVSEILKEFEESQSLGGN
ncbi:MAG: hypothetical protein KBF12_10335 [Sebaldella sp.]|nr:hypothetical protein [Sebaldella sp.]